MIGEGREPEAVVPLSKPRAMAGGSTTHQTVNVYGPNTGPDDVVLALRRMELLKGRAA
jgi:hypothetical protein